VCEPWSESGARSAWSGCARTTGLKLAACSCSLSGGPSSTPCAHGHSTAIQRPFNGHSTASSAQQRAATRTGLPEASHNKGTSQHKAAWRPKTIVPQNSSGCYVAKQGPQLCAGGQRRSDGMGCADRHSVYPLQPVHPHARCMLPCAPWAIGGGMRVVCEVAHEVCLARAGAHPMTHSL